MPIKTSIPLPTRPANTATLEPSAAPATTGTARWIDPGSIWPDDRGRHIQAHGGAIIRHDGMFYWFGEDRSPENDPEMYHVACYASVDLLHWQFRGQVLALARPAEATGLWQIERPKVYHSPATGKFVMYMHLDSQTAGNTSRYSLARIAVASCDRIDGTYTYVRSFRPLGKESRDIGQFIDDDGEAHVIFECRPDGGFYIARLSADRLDVDSAVAFVRAPIEGGAIVRHDGLYYCIGSQLTGWWPNANKFATAPRLDGPWSGFRDFAPPETHTWGSQSTNLLKITGTETTSIIYIGDIWHPYDLSDSRYLLYPLEIGGGELRLKPVGWQPGPWSIDTVTGRITYHQPNHTPLPNL